MKSRALAIGFSAFAATGLLSCDRPDPHGPAATENAPNVAVQGQSRVRDMAGYPVDVPPIRRSIDEIETAVRAQGGLATVALKAPESPRSGVTGFRPDMSAETGSRALEAVIALGVEVVDFYDAVNIVLVRVAPASVRELDASPFVDFVEPAGTVRAVNGVEDPSAAADAKEPAASRAPDVALADVVPWGVSQVQAPAAWSQATGAGARIVFMGVGINQHFDNPTVPVGNCGGLFGACNSPFSNHTMALGNALARENGQGVIGVAKGVAPSDVYVWRVWIDGSTIDLNAVYSGLNQAINLGVKLVLAQYTHLGFDQTQANLVSQLWNNGGIVVADVGYSGVFRESIYPASYSNVVGVSGVRDDGQFAGSPVGGCSSGPGSDYGPMVDITAAFWAVTTFANESGVQWFADSRAEYGLCGTYMSAAHVAGVIALLQQAHPYPSWTPTQVVSALKGTASNSASWNQQVGFGIPNASAALNYTPMSVSINGPSKVRPNTFCYYSSTVSGGTPPYAYQWHQNYLLIGTESDVSVSSAGYTSFTLSVTVTASGGTSASNSKSVTVSATAPECLQ